MTDTTQTSRYTPRAQHVLRGGPDAARSLNHATAGTEHFLMAILDDPESVASQVLAESQVTRAGVETAALVVTPRGEAPPEGVIPLSPRAVTAVKGSLTVALELGHNYVGTEHLLLALVRDPDAVATRILAANGVSADQLRQRVVDTLNRMFAARSSR
jgi:ATP-dependent Clp protease ATP-binding subunit ClpA